MTPCNPHVVTIVSKFYLRYVLDFGYLFYVKLLISIDSYLLFCICKNMNIKRVILL